MRRAIAMMMSSLLLSAAAGAAKPDLTRPPPLPPAPSWRAPAPAEGPTAAGTRVVVLAERELPLVHVLVTVAAGSALDPPAQPGLAAAVAMMLQDGGAGTRSAPEVAQAFAALGAELRVRTEPDETQLSLTVMSRHLDAALRLLGDLLARPRFDAAEWPKARARRLDEIRRQQDEPREVADDVFARVLYGDHPYGHPSLGTPAAVAALSVDDLRRFYAAHYGAKTVAFVLVGDVALESATATVTSALGGWSSTALAPPELPPAPPGGARLVLVDRPHAPQSELRVGTIGRARNTPDFAALQLLQTLLGGTFTSRLMQNLREKHGYTYGAHAHFDLWRAPGPFTAEAAVRTDVTAESLAETVGELKRMLTPLSNDEVAKGRSLVLSALVDAFADGAHAARYLGDLVAHQLPLDSWGRLPGELERLDVPSLSQAASRLFYPDRLIIVVVGDRKLIEAPLRKLPFVKSIEYRDVSGRVVR